MSLILWLGAITQGLGFAFLAWGIYLSLRVLHFADITVDGSFTLGAAAAAALIVLGVHPLLAMVVAILVSALAGAATGLISTRFEINDLLSGILTMTALYSINLHVMGRSNISLLRERTLITMLKESGLPLEEDWLVFGFFLLLVIAGNFALSWFLRTDFGLAMRATGDNLAMITAQGVDTRRMKVIGLAMANGLTGLAGALIAQYQGFADVGMGIGSLVAGIAAVILGETLVGRRTLPWMVGGVVLGSVVFRLLIALALQVGLNPIDLKLMTAAFVFAALALPRLKGLTWWTWVRRPKTPDRRTTK